MTIAGATILTGTPSHADWLPQREVDALTVAEVVRRLREAGPTIAAEAAESERGRRPTERAWSTIRKTGLFYLTVPSEFGGVDIERLDAFVEPVLAIAENCASSAWCAMQSMQHQWMIGLFPDAFRREAFGSLPYVTAAGSSFPMGKASREEGGYRVSGRYRWGSGILYAQWAFAFAAIEDGTGDVRRGCFFMPVGDVAVLDTWLVDGMAGTGSHDYVVDDVFVPEHRFLDAAAIGAGQQGRANPLQRAALPVVAPALVPLSILGAARAVVGSYRARFGRDGSSGTVSVRPGDHVALAKAETGLRIVELTIRDGIATVQTYLDRAEPVPEAVRTALRAGSAYAVGLAKHVARSIVDVAGSSAHGLDQPMQRAMRDIAMLSSHVVIDLPDAMDTHGRQLAGLPPATSRS